MYYACSRDGCREPAQYRATAPTWWAGSLLCATHMRALLLYYACTGECRFEFDFLGAPVAPAAGG